MINHKNMTLNILRCLWYI